MAPINAKRFVKPPYSISRATSIDSECCRPTQRPTFSATKRTNHAPISFDQQARVSQGHTLYRNKKSCSTEVHDGGGLELVKLACEPTSSRPKPCASLKNAPGISPVPRSFLALVGRNPAVVRDQLSPQKTPFASFIITHKKGSLLPGSSTIELPFALVM